MRRVIGALLTLMAVSGSRPADAQPLRAGATAHNRYVGAAVNITPFRNETPYRDTLAREFNMLVAENVMKFDALHPAQNTYNFTDADALVDFAEANGMAVRGHVLVWHNQIPQWLMNGSFTRDQMIAIMQDHITTVVGRYAGRIAQWDVVNEAISDNNGQPRDSIWRQRIGPDYIALAFQFAHQADPLAKLYYNDYEAEGSGVKSDAVFSLVSGLVSQGVPIDGVGWQWHKINGNNATITSAHVSNAARIANLGLELTVTEADVRIQLPSTTATLQQQAIEYGSLWSFCLSTAACRGVVTWGFTDKYSWIPGFVSGFGDALLFDVNYQPKPAYTTIDQILGGAAEPPPPPTGLTAVAGNAQVQLSWNASTGATSYNVKRSTTDGGPYTTIASGSGTSFLDTGRTNGTTYFYRVSAVNASGEGANSSQVSATPQAPNFAVAVSPASVTVARGGTSTATVSLTRTGGFSAQVCLTLPALPSGVTASLNHACTPPDTFTVTFTASATASLGTSNLALSAAGGGLTRTATFALTVAPGQTPDFSLAVSPASVTVNRGASGTATVAITRTGGFTGAVDLGVSGLPAGVTPTFSADPASGGSSVLTLAASATATLGTVNVTISGTGTGVSGTRTTTLGLTVGPAQTGNGGVTVTPSLGGNPPWYNETRVGLANTGSLTALTVTIVVQRTAGLSLNGMFDNVGGFTATNNASANLPAITFTWTRTGGSLGAGSGRLFVAQTNGNQPHPSSGDTWTVSYTTGGQTFTQRGGF